MERLSRIGQAIRRVVTTRRFAAAVLAVITLVTSVAVSVNAHAVTVTDGDVSRVVLTMHSDPYKAVESAGVHLENYDRMTVDPNASTIDIDRAMTVEVKADGLSTLLYMNDGNVSQALRRAEVSVGKYDTLNVDQKAPVTDGMQIVVDRVAYQDYTVTQTIPYETQTKFTIVLKPGKTKVMKAGSSGTRVITYRKTIVNGQVVETNKIGEKTTKNPVTRVVLKGASYGTPLSAAPSGIKLDSKGQPVNYKKVFKSKSCTAYSIGKRGASGLKLGVGTVAVNPKVIPYGSKLWITSADGKFVYGYAIAADTGAFAADPSGRTFIDVYMGSYTEACKWGRRTMNIYVIG